MKNKIKILLKERKITVQRLSDEIGMDYPSTHKLVNREDLSNTTVKSLKAVADFLDVEVMDLWED